MVGDLLPCHSGQDCQMSLSHKMSRIMALRALQGLTPDLQELIFRRSFPTKHQIRLRLEQQQNVLPEFTHLDSEIAEFIHNDQDDLELASLTPREKRWVYFRGQLFGLQHFSYLGQDGRILVLLKTDDWYYSGEPAIVARRWDQLSLQKQVYWCEECGLEQNGVPIFRQRAPICHGCYGHLVLMGEADENGWMEELSFGMVGF